VNILLMTHRLVLTYLLLLKIKMKKTLLQITTLSLLTLFSIGDVSAQPTVIEFSVISCDARGGYSTTQMGVKNLGEKTLDTVYIKYNVIDDRGRYFKSDSWFFKGIRQDKTVIDRVLAIDSISCGEIKAIEIVTATCRFAGESTKYGCLNVVKPVNGALKVIK
jgi:hypothetical protein